MWWVTDDDLRTSILGSFLHYGTAFDCSAYFVCFMSTGRWGLGLRRDG